MKATPYNNIAITIEQNSVGSSDALLNIPIPSTVSLVPGGDSSATVEYTTDPLLVVWRQWPKGSVSIYTEDVLTANIIAIRITVLLGTATLNVIGGRNG
jgi:hypothetical protein